MGIIRDTMGDIGSGIENQMNERELEHDMETGFTGCIGLYRAKRFG